jgi:hypothetical protein
MALSDHLSRLAARAKQAETRVAGVREEARADVEQDLASARESAQEQATRMQRAAEGNKERVSNWWGDVQTSWNQHLSRVREDMESKKVKHDVNKAKRRADEAEEYALFMIDLAYSAVVESEYAALDALLAGMDADQMAKEAATGTGTGS